MRYNQNMIDAKKYFLVIFLVIIFASCQSSQVQDTQTANENEKAKDFAEMRPDIRNLDELTVVFSSHDIELDFRKSYYSSEAQIFTGIYEGLFSYHPVTLEPVPAMAASWLLSEDKKQWTFNIRQSSRYWNGDPITAEDFRTAWLSLLDPQRDSPYSSFFDVIEGARDYRNGIERNPETVGISVPNPRTLIVKLNSPASFFPAMLCHHSFSPIHSSMVNKKDWSAKDGQGKWTPPVSNGPYKIVSMNEENILLQKNEYYWDRNRVLLDKINVKFSKTAEEAARLWNSGEARWIAGEVSVDSLTDRSGIQVNVLFATHYYFIRSSDKPWNDHRVRRAMALVLPWEEIRKDYYLPAETLIFPIIGYPTVEGIKESNIDEAKKLMDEAGYANTAGLPELVIRLTPSRDAERIGIIMANAWKNILGFNVRVEVIPYSRYFDSMKEGGYTIGSTTWIGDFADPYAFLQMWQRDSNLNDARLNDADFEELIERSMIEEGIARLETLSRAEKLLLERGAVLPICFNPALNIVDTGELDGWYPNALDIHPFKYLSFKAYRPLPGVAFAK